MIKVYFCNRYDELRQIATVQSEEEAYKEISNFCKDRNFTIYYVRTWFEPRDGRNMKKYDVGSHSEFFYTEVV